MMPVMHVMHVMQVHMLIVHALSSMTHNEQALDTLLSW